MDQAFLAALRTLLRSSHFAAPDDLPSLVQVAGGQLGACVSRVYLVDYKQAALVPLIGPEESLRAQPVPIDRSLAGRAFSDVAQRISRAGNLLTLWTPLLDGTERLGVLELGFPADVSADEEFFACCRDVAALVAELTLTRALYGDLIERTRRRQPLTVAAEMQWRLMPPLTFVSRGVAIAGIFAPAEQVAGDCFDYALNGDRAHVAVLDAMGHGLEASLLSAVAVSCLRNARRQGLGIADAARSMDMVINAQFGPDKFVTAVIGELEMPTGLWRWATCGHPPALLVRSGRVVKKLDAVVNPPLGLGLLPENLPIGEESLEPGDRLLLYTDGVIEARDAAGTFFGTERLVELMRREAAAGRPVPETLRRLNHAILKHQEGQLQDDATTVVVEWMTNEQARTAPSLIRP